MSPKNTGHSWAAHTWAAHSSAGARRRDRRVYLRGHPLLFALLAATRGRAVRRIGNTVLVHEAAAYREALTRLPLDRTAAGTTGGAAREALSSSSTGGDGGVLFDQDGGAHRAGRRDLAADLGAAGVERLRAVWRPLLDRASASLGRGEEVDLVSLARELSGSVVCALVGSAADPVAVADAAAETAAASVRDHLPGPRRAGRATALATARLLRLLGARDDPLAAMTAVAAVNTTVAAVPRAVAWCADAGLWEQAAAGAAVRPLADELLRLTAPSPLLPRVAAADGTVGGRPVRTGDRLLLIARHAAGAHLRRPAPDLAHLVFGAGPHTCPGARLARVQLADVLACLAPYRPVVVRARADRRAALPGWRSLTVRATAAPAVRAATAPAVRDGQCLAVAYGSPTGLPGPGLPPHDPARGGETTGDTVPGNGLADNAASGGALPDDAAPSETPPCIAAPSGALPGIATQGGALAGDEPGKAPADAALSSDGAAADEVPHGALPHETTPGRALPGTAAPGGAAEGGALRGGEVPSGRTLAHSPAPATGESSRSGRCPLSAPARRDDDHDRDRNHAHDRDHDREAGS
ncbi:hypothetical protein [Streptomyces sp. GC420]|uniref:hypothetical protein n=1 Tax=Streptomyces sp. GC420 TaxID=2697568 RepID=UPI001AA131A3|nr:hypothetical protein [Streptomyces sp. GC420]